MDWFERHCSLFDAPDLVLHLGAGEGRQLPAYQAARAARIVLVEPRPDCVGRLRDAAREVPAVRVEQVALDRAGGTAAFHLFNHSLLSGLHQADAVQTLLPGVVQRARIEVETESLAELSERLGVSPGDDNWLVIDTPGVEDVIVDALAEPSLAGLFSQIYLVSCARGLTGAPSSSERLVEALEALDYRRLGAADREDPDWPRVHLLLDESQARNRELERQLETATTERNRRGAALAELEASSRQREQALVSARQDLESRLRAIEDELQAERRRAGEVAETADDYRRANEELDQQRNELRDQVQAIGTQLAEAREAAAGRERSVRELELRRDDLESRVEALRSDLAQATDAAQERLAELQRRLDVSRESVRVGEQRIEGLAALLAAQQEENQQLSDAGEERVRALDEQLERARSDLSVSLRVQSQREADLADLQSRYASLLELKNRQQELLVKLGKRLGSASDYLRQLAVDDEDRASTAQAERLVEALSGDLEAKP